MSDPPPTPRELFEALFPGLFQAKVLTLSAGAAFLAIVVAILSVTLPTSTDGRIALAVLSALIWGQGGLWLVNGQIESGPAGLSNLAGAKWGVFLGLWWIPVWIAWILLAPRPG